jgi:lipoprotein-releasing system permease protein
LNFLFTWRYFKAKKSTNAINIISWVSVSAITVGTASLIVVLSVFNGLEQLVQSLYSAFYTDIRVSAVRGKFISVSEKNLEQVKQLKGISGYSLTIEDKALLQFNSNQQIVVLKGVDSNYQHISGISRNISRGKFALGTADHPDAVLGAGVESGLNLESDRAIAPVTAYLFRNGPAINPESPARQISPEDPASAVRSAQIAAAGAFRIQQDFDNKYVITNMLFMQRVLGLDSNQYSAVEIACLNPATTNDVKDNLQRIFGPGYKVQTRYEQNQTLFNVMRMEKWVIYAMLSLILAVAAFNMVGALTMLVLEKKKDIQVLKAMGANNRYIQRIFLNEGLLLGLLGGIGGVLLALLACWLQVQFKLVPLQGNFLIDYYPVKIIPGDLLLVGGTILVVALLASWLPARKAARQVFELKS